MELLVGAGNCLKKKVIFPEIPTNWIELVTLDIDPTTKPNVCHDLTNLPLPFDDDMFDEIHAYEVLEHTGRQGDWMFFFNQFMEFHRILKPGGYMIGTCPMWDSPWAWGDPGHTRVLSKECLTFLSQDEYEKQVGKTAMTDYRGWYKADFELTAASEENDNFGFVLKAKK